ncbi:IS66 family insertion sequence element accessory protein TnpB [Sorangium atrum]|uniref:IS66 family insertion sequence element accessory protein TnpB n=1 Tax=Sorangium atrum TaxID=2995308 RepID=UPI00358DBC07
MYVAAEPTDLRKSFDGLLALVSQRFGADPLCGHLFVFRNRRGDQVRVLFWDRSPAAAGSRPCAMLVVRRGRWRRTRRRPTRMRRRSRRGYAGSASMRT